MEWGDPTGLAWQSGFSSLLCPEWNLGLLGFNQVSSSPRVGLMGRGGKHLSTYLACRVSKGLIWWRLPCPGGGVWWGFSSPFPEQVRAQRATLHSCSFFFRKDSGRAIVLLQWRWPRVVKPRPPLPHLLTPTPHRATARNIFRSVLGNCRIQYS